MKLKAILLSLLFMSISVFAQDYPEVSIYDIQYQHPDSLLANGDLPSPLDGDTVTVTGVVMNSTYMGANPDSTETIAVGAPGVFLQDTGDVKPYSGIVVRDETESSDFALLDTGFVVKITGVVSEYYTTTQLNVVSFTAQDILGQGPMPEPVPVTLDSLREEGTSANRILAEKWEGMLISIEEDLTVTEENIVGAGTFGVVNQNSTEGVVYNRSNYYRGGVSPNAGAVIDYIEGHFETQEGTETGYCINPMYPDDVKLGATPPSITNTERDKPTVSYGESVTITSDIVDFDGTVTGAELYYAVNGEFDGKVDMQYTGEGTTYEGTIPAYNDSSFVEYYIKATDDSNFVSTFPSDTTTNRLSYFVLDRPLGIKEIQYSPRGSGFGSYTGYDVTLTGIVTVDTTGVNNPPSIYIQNGNSPWSGIRIFGALSAEKGDELEVTGTVEENFGVTQIAVSDFNILSNGNEVPAPVEIQTSVVDELSDGEVEAEQYEGMLLKYSNLTVTDVNADGGPGPVGENNSNFGEIFVADDSGVDTRVELQDGNNNYHNLWDSTLVDEPGNVEVNQDASFDVVTGVLYYSFGNYKLIPRTNSDFEGYVVGVEDDNTQMPMEYKLAQNYPNPFNPSTTIEFSLPKAADVSLKVYNVLGEEVAELVNKNFKAGAHKVNFNASQFASGVYIYRLKAKDFVSVKKMILMK